MGKFASIGSIVALLFIMWAVGTVISVNIGNPAPQATNQTYIDALQGTPAAVLAYCSDMNREPGGHFADCVAWLEIMREIEAGR